MLLQSTDALSGKEHLCVDGEDPGVRYLGPWAQYTFPQKEYSLDQQARQFFWLKSQKRSPKEVS